jgi:hypothetical protein
MVALGLALGGWIAGTVFMWVLLEFTKYLFGKKVVEFNPASRWNVIQPDRAKPPIVVMGTEHLNWEDIFTRSSDRFLIQCTELNVNSSRYKDVCAILSTEAVTFRTRDNQDSRFAWTEVNALGGVAARTEIPREMMGFGVVLLTGMAGAYLGPQPLWSLVGLTAALMLAHATVNRLLNLNNAKSQQVAPFMFSAGVIVVVQRILSVT